MFENVPDLSVAEALVGAHSAMAHEKDVDRVIVRRRDQPAAIVVIAENRREASLGIETRQAHPVDGAVASDERRGLAVADHGIVFDGERHDEPA